MGSGLGLGLLVALAVYLHGARPAAPSMPAPAPAAPETAPPADPAPGAPAQAVPAARFDFYEVLPQFEVVVPEGGSAPRAPRAVRSVRAVEEPGRYVVQAGSFKALGDADRRQAQLALLGIESRIESVTLGDGTYHRVRIGPIDDVAELNRIRGRLHTARVESLLLQAPE